MRTEITLQTGVVADPKTIRLMRRCGDRAFYCLVRLWIWGAQWRPTGELTGFDKVDVEAAAGWTGVEGVFAAALLDLGLISEGETGLVLNDFRG